MKTAKNTVPAILSIIITTFCLTLWQAQISIAANPILEVTDHFIRVKTETLEVRWNRDGNGTPYYIRTGEHTFSPDNTSPIHVEVWQIQGKPTLSDRLEGIIADAQTQKVSWQTHRTENSIAIAAESSIRWPAMEADDRLDWTVTWIFETNTPGPAVEIGIDVAGNWENRVIRELSWQIPMGLEHRKRVAQGGDQGFDWDTRYYYNYVLGLRRQLLTNPEVNIWRHFTVEQETPKTYRLWRAQGNDTAPLIMQRGHQAAGWIGAYDQNGGFFAAYRDLALKAPKTLRVDAKGAGLLQLQLSPPTAPARHPLHPAFKQQITGSHRLELIIFEGDWDLENKSRQLRKWWQVGQLASDTLRKPSVPKEEWLEKAGDPNDPVFPVSGGVPFPSGALGTDDGIRVFLQENELPVQWEPLAYWPDGSVKWALLIFPLNPETLHSPGRGEGFAFDTEISLRDESRVPVRIMHGKNIQPARIHAPVHARLDAQQEKLQVENPELQIMLQTGLQWLGELKRGGLDLLMESGEPLAFVDYLDLKETYRPLDAHAQGNKMPGPVNITNLQLEETGPVRAVARMEGVTEGRQPVRIIMRMESYAGSSWIRVWKTVEFLDADPRMHMVSAMGLSLPLALNTEETLFYSEDHSGDSESESMSLMQFSPTGYRNATLRNHEDTPETKSLGKQSQGWLSIGDSDHAVTVIQRYFLEQAPRENRAERKPQPRLTAYFWPDSSPVMDVRRYSSFPHRGQNESVPHNNNDWVYTSHDDNNGGYYNTDPFKGISRTFESLWGFHEPNPDPQDIQRIAADFHSRPLIYAGESRYRETGVALPWGDVEEFPKITHNHNSISDFWLHNQRFWNWYGWTHGDMVHMHHGGLGQILTSEDLRAMLALPQEIRFKGKAAENAIQDYYPDNQWGFDNGRWGWVQTERLPGQFWQVQYLRSGRRADFFQAEAISVYSRDVIIRHHGRWFGRGTRHGVQPWSCGNHEERQTVHLEWRHHYFLTGDKRSADVNDRLTHEYYLRNPVGGAANPSGRLPGLFMHWERTGDRRSREALETYLNAMIVPEGLQFPPYLDLTTGEMRGEGPVNSSAAFFHTFGAMHTVLEYWYATDHLELRESLKDAIIRMAYHSAQDENINMRRVGLALGFAAKNSPEPDIFLNAIDDFLNYQSLFHTVTENKMHWTGPTAYRFGGSNQIWETVNIVPYVTSAWEKLNISPRLTSREREEIRLTERYGVVREIPQLSWQHEYDDPVFDDYLKCWRPWEDCFVHPSEHWQRPDAP